MFAFLSGGPAAAHSTLRPEDEALLRARAATWLEASRSYGTTDIPQDRLVAEMEAIGDTLEAAGLDSLAARVLAHAGYVGLRQGDGNRAVRDWNRAIAVGERGGDESDVMAARMLLADHDSSRDFDASIRTMEEAAAYYARVHEDSSRCDVIEHIAVLYKAAGRYEDALHRSRLLEDAARDIGYESQHAEALVLQSMCLALESREEEALLMADSALVVQERCGPDREIMRGRVQTARAVALRALGRDDEALEATLDAIQVAQALHSRRHLRSLAYMKGLIDFDLGRYEEVRAGMESPISEAAGDGDEWPELTYRIMHAAALVGLRRYAEAETLLTGLIPRVETFRRKQTNEETQAGFFTQLGELYATQARLFLETDRAGEAWSAVEGGRAMTLKERFEAFGPAPAPADIQARLAETHAALIQFSEPLYNPVVAFVVTGDTVMARVLGRPFRAAEAAGAGTLLASGAAEAICDPALQRLGDRLLSGCAGMIPSGVDRVYIVPPTALAGVPFEVLPVGGDPAARLGDRWAVGYLPYAGILDLLAREAPAAGGMLVMADPSHPNGSWSLKLPSVFRGLLDVPLPAARDEARAVAIPGAEVLTGRHATRKRLESPDTSRRAVLHFATHAVENTVEPDSSGILLAGQDGLTSPTDVAGLRLHADLVTLSGCRTEGGRVFRGEGVFSLSRAFLIAGSRSVVTSLWDVEDRAAARFMGDFYEYLKSGLPRDESLRRTREDLRGEGYPPRDWAAFILTGLGHEPVPSLARAAVAAHPESAPGN